MIIGLSHVAIAAPNIAEAAELLRRRFGMVIGPGTENTQQKTRLAYADLGNTRLELIEPLTDDSPLTGFLACNPNGGLHHIILHSQWGLAEISE
jgi:methylmalonyl-CoA/ethylmalonyl-CoA epimerase